MTKRERQQAAEENTLERLRQVARDNSNGDPVLEEVLLWNLHYNWGKGRNPRIPWIDEPHIVNGVKFWRVGHNASHEFYLGTDGNGKRFRRAVGESLDFDWEGKPLVFDEKNFFFPTETPGLDESIDEVTEFGGYLGHH